MNEFKLNNLSKYCFQILIIMFLLLLSPFIYAQTNESIIKSYNSNIILQPDGALNITEIINVMVDGNVIKHGIYRDFPTDYQLMEDGTRHIDFKLIDTQLDGNYTPNHLADMNNGVRIYIGDPHIYLNPGWHTFTLNYLVKYALGFFSDHDELYWNVTGNGWEFPIQETLVNITVPPNVAQAITGISGYTGVYGAKGNNFIYQQMPNNVIQFKSTAQLNPGEGLSVVVGWKKGLISPPPFSLRDFLLNLLPRLRHTPNIANFILGGGTLIIFLYYLFVWAKLGKTPRKGSVFPEYEPPAGFSAAALRYMMDMGYDQKVFVAALINMAIKGYLVIKEENKEYTLSRLTVNTTMLSGPEITIANKLFVSGNDVTLNQKNYALFTDTINAFKEELRKEFQGIYFQENAQYVFKGVVLSNAVIFLSLWLSHSISIVHLGWAGLFILVMFGIIKQLDDAVWHKYILAIFGNFFGIYIFFLVMSSPQTGIIFSKSDLYYCIILAVLALLNGVFCGLLKTVTAVGRTLMDHIAGFKMFLAATEKEQLKFINPPTLTPELFDKYLPFAIALDLDENWSKKFSTVLANATQVGQYHQPTWYIGPNYNHFNYANFSSNLSSSLGAAVSSATTAQSSGSSGFSSGGGFSGGGFGGGGGGGW